jgi:cation diffusion facilitator CzcD-associated flavoprotein CzcO
MSSAPSSRILIIGSGFAGIALGHALRRAGVEDFQILEKGARLGGTWRDNVYPGAACDVPSLLYCLSFEPKSDWSRKWAPQAEILAYMHDVARKHGLLPHVRFETEVASARYDEQTATWHVRTTAGEQLTASVLVSAVGQLNRPAWPDIPGREGFAGASFHSAEWDAGVRLAGQRVAVVGNAASAIQLVPHVAAEARELHVLQRSANWMLRRGDRAYTRLEHALFRRVPLLARLTRFLLWVVYDLRFPLFVRNAFAVRRATRLALAYLEETVADPELRRKLTPDYEIGAKRILISDDYYATLQRPNVRLVTDAVERMTPDGIALSTGEHLGVDVIIYATGFQSTAFLAPMTIVGSAGQSLEDAWRDGSQAYLGLMVAGFPNFFMLYGPNTNLGHNSILFMLECQARYIVQCLAEMDRRDADAMDVRPEVMNAYNDRIQAELGETVWARVTRSWYQDARGRIVNNWPGSTLRYWRESRRPDFTAYRFVSRRAQVEAAPANAA